LGWLKILTRHCAKANTKSSPQGKDLSYRLLPRNPFSFGNTDLTTTENNCGEHVLIVIDTLDILELPSVAYNHNANKEQ
jgi:hypothetical protein